jgi:ribosomal protein S18 acetylase RimI-like enzyme
MGQQMPGVIVADAASQAAESAFAGAAHRILAALVRDGAALGWLEPPPLAEVAALLRSVGEASAAGDAALRAAYLPPGDLPPGDLPAGDLPAGDVPPPSRLIGLGYWTRYTRPTHRPHADVRHVAVARQAQGRGAGRALTSALIDAARVARIEVLTLDARGDNTGALHLYRSLGFTEYGRLRGFVAVGERRYDTVFCALDLRERAAGAMTADGPA